MLHQKTTWIDFSDVVLFRGHSTQGVAHVHRTHDLFATYGLSATRRLSSMRATLRRQSQNPNFLLSRPVWGGFLFLLKLFDLQHWYSCYINHWWLSMGCCCRVAEGAARSEAAAAARNASGRSAWYSFNAA